MKFHWPSFLLGYGVGVGTAALSERLRPLALEIMTSVYRALDGLLARVVMKREDLADFFAEAKARARAITARAPEPSVH